MPSQPILRVVRPGDAARAHPFTICIVANPALETPWKSGVFAPDPIQSHRSEFDASVEYVSAVLFGELPGQAEHFFGDSEFASRVRVVSLWVSGLAPEAETSLAANDDSGDLLVPRRATVAAFLARYGVQADVAFIVSRSETHFRASTFYTTDDDSRDGVPFTLDGMRLVHRFHCRIPGTVALHTTSRSLTALHEFTRAVELLERRDRRPVRRRGRGGEQPARTADPGAFPRLRRYDDQERRGARRHRYPAEWQSFHGELHDGAFPAVMDDYWQAPDGVPEHCEHDRITRAFLLDRVRAKMRR
jgi:hypothetical protein